MKKYIFSVLMAAIAAFTFSSCEDVPEPYTLPTKPDAGGTTDPNQKGSESNPYTVAEMKKKLFIPSSLLSSLLSSLIFQILQDAFCHRFCHLLLIVF